MYRRFALAALAACLLPTAALADYGAIAFSRDTGAHGYSFGKGSRRDAESTALRACGKYAGDCAVVIYFRNACGALAVGENNGFGYAWNVNRGTAEQRALRACQKRDDRCRVIRWSCSG